MAGLGPVPGGPDLGQRGPSGVRGFWLRTPPNLHSPERARDLRSFLPVWAGPAASAQRVHRPETRSGAFQKRWHQPLVTALWGRDPQVRGQTLGPAHSALLNHPHTPGFSHLLAPPGPLSGGRGLAGASGRAEDRGRGSLEEGPLDAMPNTRSLRHLLSTCFVPGAGGAAEFR